MDDALTGPGTVPIDEAPVMPFRIRVDASEHTDLAERLARTRFSAPVLRDGAGGMDGPTLKRFVDYWSREFRWSTIEERLSEFTGHLVDVGDCRVHVLRARPDTPSRQPPLVLLHGWPGSPLEFFDVIPRLTHPERFGGDAQDAFDVLVPELPGFGWSTLPAGVVEPARMAAVIARALDTLGVARYGLVGGDVGAHVLRFLAGAHPERVVGVHTHHPALHADIAEDEPLTGPEHAWLDDRAAGGRMDDSYASIQEHRPDTIAAALTDSPAGLAAWLLEKYRDWSGAGSLDAYNPSLIAGTVSWYWFSRSIGSSFRAYTDDALTPPAPLVRVPTAVTLTPEDAAYPREYAARTYTDIRQWRPPRFAGHFFALEDPAGLAQDLTDFFSSLRT